MLGEFEGEMRMKRSLNSRVWFWCRTDGSNRRLSFEGDQEEQHIVIFHMNLNAFLH